jgi:hypothetical protein
MTLGCGAAGGNITSDNISPLHLINLKRVAYGVREVSAAPPGRANAAIPSTPGKRATIEQVVDQWLGFRASPSLPAAAAAAPVAPQLASFKELEPAKPKAEKKEPKPVGFVCEDDVRTAIQANAKIVVGKKTIITPSARDLGEINDVFVPAD